MTMQNRKLIRPNLAEIKERFSPHRGGRASESNSRETAGGNGHARRRVAPPESTSAEAFYYLKQMNGQTPMVVVLNDGEQLRGHIEWYDRSCLKVHRPDEPNLLVFKQHIKYLYKQEDE
jgi:sRNA-binding regulator protein Hfq